MSSRLAPFFPDDDGARQVLGVGPYLGDTAYVDIATGALSLANALVQEACKRRFDIVIRVNLSGEFVFGSEEMRQRFEEATDAKSRDPRNRGGSRRQVPDVSETVQSDKVRDQVPAVDVSGQDALAGALGKLDRAVEKLAGSLFVLLPDIDGLLVRNTLPSPRARQLLVVTGRLFASGRGSSRSRMVVFSSDDFAEDVRTLLQEHDRGASPWQEVRVSTPDVGEIADFLERVKSRHGLYGNVAATAKLLAQRGYALTRISEAIRTRIDDGERDLASLIGAEYDERAVADIQAELNSMVGMAQLKNKIATLVNMTRQQQAALQRGELLEPPSTHIALLGRPGTGKTAVVRIIARLLHAAGVRRRGSPHVEIGVKDIVSEYNPGEVVQKMQRHILSASGGVLFIDEAYGLADDAWCQGAVTTLVHEMENRRGDLTVVLAGYPERMESLFRLNAGLRSRISDEYIFHLPDYTQDELCEIADCMIAARKVTIAEDAESGAHAIIRREETRPHANGRAVRNFIESWDKARIARGGVRFEASDIIDPRCASSAEAEAIVTQFEQDFLDMKEATKWMRDAALGAANSLARGRLEPAPRMLFVGPPGTGKTETARRLGEFLRAAGVLLHGRLREVSLQDFTSQFQGESEQRTRQLFEECREGILFIDEAYRLADGAQGQAVLHQIVQHLTDREFESVCVVMAGYDKEMRELLRTNAGLGSRFPHTVRFESPSSTALAEIARRHLERTHAMRPPKAEQEQFMEQLVKAIHAKRTSANFAGARTAISLADAIRNNALTARRTTGECLIDDIPRETAPPEFDVTMRAFREHFLDQPELEKAVQRLIASFVIGLHEQRTIARGIRLLGAPGTGKSTFARWLRETFAARAGSASLPHVDVSAQSLKGEYVGHAQAHVARAFDSARGGFLFIDEFHALAPQDVRTDEFGKSAIEQIVAQMQQPANVRTTVIIAGYPGPMRHALRADDGLERRFPHEVEIPPPTSRTLAQITLRRLAKSVPIDGVHPDTIAPMLERHFDKRRAEMGDSFGNCGDAENLADRIRERTVIRHEFRVGPVTVSDIVEELDT